MGSFANLCLHSSRAFKVIFFGYRGRDFKGKNFNRQIWPEEGIKKFREILETREFKDTSLQDGAKGRDKNGDTRKIIIKKRTLGKKKW